MSIRAEYGLRQRRTIHIVAEMPRAKEREDFREHLDFILNRQQNGDWHRITPQAWVTDREYNQQDFKGVKEEFLAERTRSIEWLKGLSEADWTKGYVSEFGGMTAGDMLSSWVAHDNLHIRQLVELRRFRLEKMVDPYNVGYAGDW